MNVGPILPAVLVGAAFMCLGAAAPQRTLVAFGDSTTAPRKGVSVYATRLQASLPDGWAIVNAGTPGDTTADAAERFTADVTARKPRIVVIQFGINDSMVDVWKRPPATAPRVSPEQYRRNLESFIAAIAKQNARVILMTPNPLRWTPALRERYAKPPYDPDAPDGLSVMVARYAGIVRDLADAPGVELIDVYEAFEAYGRREGRKVDDLLLDGMHPNDAGHRIIADLLAATVTKSTTKEPPR